MGCYCSSGLPTTVRQWQVDALVMNIKGTDEHCECKRAAQHATRPICPAWSRMAAHPPSTGNRKRRLFRGFECRGFSPLPQTIP